MPVVSILLLGPLSHNIVFIQLLFLFVNKNAKSYLSYESIIFLLLQKAKEIIF